MDERCFLASATFSKQTSSPRGYRPLKGFHSIVINLHRLWFYDGDGFTRMCCELCWKSDPFMGIHTCFSRRGLAVSHF